MAGIEDGEVGFEQVMLLDEAIRDTTKKLEIGNHKQHRHRPKSSAESLPLRSKSSCRQHHRSKYPINRASGGPGMQAIFLESGEKSCGTGVFLPRSADAKFQPSKKPACSPVLLPSRVVQALNLNVHALGLQISPRQDAKINTTKSGDSKSVQQKNEKVDVSTKCCAMSHDENPSPEIFLPNEWTY
ncbi:hypothetical protein CFOL_v3_32910 [Cephalotus follicularis]|uniref:Uncharacterized protein n=1 Tax=Cephalotus follicularis TaxID=3775 RepID=A0A1Q3DAE9_CEPFO|nr:hypothetical protein CFOL_v3_32910 [Cephalotus follicularis]